MVSKYELKERYEELCKAHILRKESNEKKFSEDYLKKSRHNLELAGLLDLLSRDKEKKAIIQISLSSEYFDWIIITSYYACILQPHRLWPKSG
jgi:hypothetical protein